MRFLVEVEGWDAHDQLCSRMMSHLEQAGEKFRIMNGNIYISFKIYAGFLMKYYLGENVFVI
jgi:hypothetical protein